MQDGGGSDDVAEIGRSKSAGDSYEEDVLTCSVFRRVLDACYSNWGCVFRVIQRLPMLTRGRMTARI